MPSGSEDSGTAAFYAGEGGVKTIVAIDPGPESSAVMLLRNGEPSPLFGFYSNEDAIDVLHEWLSEASTVVCESIESYGMPVGKDVFETCYWIGEFRGEVRIYGRKFVLWPRRQVKLQLCGNSRAKDSNIRQALLDRFPATGGGKTPQVGTKSQPGPLYGVKSHLWSALAVGVSWYDAWTQAQEAA